MSERVLHEWVDDNDRTWRVTNIPHGDTIIPWAYRYGLDGRCESSDGGAVVDELARLAARVAELEAENAKLRACVKASDDARGDGCCPVCDSEAGASHWIDCPWRDYDAARAEVDKP